MAAPVTKPDGSVQVEAFTLPFSELASAEARAQFLERKSQSTLNLPPGSTIVDIRRVYDQTFAAPNIARQKARYRVTMTEEMIAGVFTQVFKPEAGISPENRDRVLINLHGGGFIYGGRSQSQVESIPIAAEGAIKVVSVDYRMAPEARFPAASEDVAAVYRELLKTYRPENIGIYGCSAGGYLAAESVAWFQKVGLPQPAAIAVLCGAVDRRHGDSAWIGPRIGSILGAPDEPSPDSSYFTGADDSDPMMAPSRSPAVLAKFPPTLLITGTRAGEMGAATRSHIDLVKVGVDARLFLWDGLDHGFMNNPELPESREAYEVIIRFFREQMDTAGRSAAARR
jgi:epsilon-lactone hydrolase